jgi:hypothetical protein
MPASLVYMLDRLEAQAAPRRFQIRSLTLAERLSRTADRFDPQGVHLSCRGAWRTPPAPRDLTCDKDSFDIHHPGCDEHGGVPAMDAEVAPLRYSTIADAIYGAV